MNHHSKMARLASLLSFMPPLERIARSLVLDIFVPFNPTESIIYYLNENDEVTSLAAYGTNELVEGIQIPRSTWRRWVSEEPSKVQAFSLNTISWSEEKCQIVVNLNAQGVLIGFLALKFSESVEDTNKLNIDAEAACLLISLYLSFNLQNTNERGEISKFIQVPRKPLVRRENETPHLSERQRTVLLGLVAQKTNNVIASELGYSVSTVRHETIRIFQALGVSDRVAAAQQAKALGIVYIPIE